MLRARSVLAFSVFLGACASQRDAAPTGTTTSALAATGTELLSKVNDVPANARSWRPVLMTQAEVAAFVSEASNWDNHASPTIPQVYVHDRTDDVTLLISVGDDGYSNANASAHSPSMSLDAGRVAYVSAASNLTPDSPGIDQVYFRDREVGTTTRLPTTKPAHQPQISGDGEHICFTTHEALDPNDTNGDADVYVYDIAAGSFRWVSADPAYATGKHCAISADGSVVAFVAKGAVVARNLATSTTTLVARADAQGRISLSEDGSHVAFTSGDAVYVAAVATGTVTAVSRGVASAEDPSLDAAGDLVAFSGKRASGDPEEIFTVDLATLTQKRVSVDDSGKRFTKAVMPYLSDDGVSVAFAGKEDGSAIEECYLVAAR